jgi:asparagine synthase (glutamine-hydrolysing)
VELRQHRPAIEPYWAAPDVNTAARIPDEYELEALLEHAVKRQMISDVPIGAFLSGGIDSSLLVALMARHSGTPVRTFSVSFAKKVLTNRRLPSLSPVAMERIIQF